MSLPATTRPKTVADLQEEERRRSELKLVIRKPNVFMAAMTEWYGNLSKKERGELTKRKLCRRAVLEAFQLNLPYHSLPAGWIKTLKKTVGLKIFIRSSRLQRRRARLEFEKATKGALSETEDCNKSSTSVSVETAGTSDSNWKRFLDLTDEPPPAFWIESISKGIVLPRYQAIYSTPEHNIVYWDYNEKNWEHLCGAEPAVKYAHKGNGFDWFRKIVLEQEQKKIEISQKYGIEVADLEEIIENRENASRLRLMGLDETGPNSEDHVSENGEVLGSLDETSPDPEDHVSENGEVLGSLDETSPDPEDHVSENGEVLGSLDETSSDPEDHVSENGEVLGSLDETSPDPEDHVSENREVLGSLDKTGPDPEDRISENDELIESLDETGTASSAGDHEFENGDLLELLDSPVTAEAEGPVEPLFSDGSADSDLEELDYE